MSAPRRERDTNRVYQNPISNVNVLKNLSANSYTTSPSFKGSQFGTNPSIGNVQAKLNKWLNDGKPEVTATIGRSVKKATGETTSEARQKAYNAASTEHTDNLKSGTYYQQEKTADGMSRFPSKEAPIKINTDPAKGK
jgi:hypothetical protein